MQFFVLIMQSVVLVPLTLLPIINPLGNAPIFTAMAGGSASVGQTMARQVAINSWVILVASMLVGSYVLEIFGISLPIVRVGGGLLVAATGWRLLHAEDTDPVRVAVAGQAEELSARELAKRSFFPMSFPLTAGPGSIAASIALGTGTPSTSRDYLLGVIVAVLGPALTAVVIYVSYRYSTVLLNRLGDIGTVVMMRFVAFILLCIGLQMVWTGWTGLTMLPPSPP